MAGDMGKLQMHLSLRQCRKLNEDGRPNLQDFKAIAIGDIPTYQDYTRLAAGLKLIYSVLLKLRKRLTG